jgi:hypothetical protein
VDTARGLAYLHAKKDGSIIHRCQTMHAHLLHATSCTDGFPAVKHELAQSQRYVACRDLKPGNLMISGSQYHSRCSLSGKVLFGGFPRSDLRLD